jgi:hypothetical protein
MSNPSLSRTLSRLVSSSAVTFLPLMTIVTIFLMARSSRLWWFGASIRRRTETAEAPRPARAGAPQGARRAHTRRSMQPTSNAASRDGSAAECSRIYASNPLDFTGLRFVFECSHRRLYRPLLTMTDPYLHTSKQTPHWMHLA